MQLKLLLVPVVVVLAVGCTTTNNTTITEVNPPKDMVKVAAGKFKVGAANSDYTLSSDFWIDKNEVTNKEYAAFLASEGGRGLSAPRHWGGNTPPAGIGDRPVRFVSYADAMKFAQHNKKSLPSVQEWECAARGPQGSWFPWGDDNKKANEKSQIGGYYDDKDPTAPVGHFADRGGNTWVNARDMFGNVYEWTSSKKDGAHIVKGGSFQTPISLGKVTLGYDGTADPASGHEGVGFRCIWRP